MHFYTWRVVITTVQQYCRRYAAIEKASAQSSNAAGHLAREGGVNPLNPMDVKALCAYLRLFR